MYTFIVMSPQEITVRSPATSANMGPGFDSLGIALDVWNSVTVHEENKLGNSVLVRGKGEESLSSGKDNLVFQSFSRLFEEIGDVVPNVLLECDNQIELSRGMGSSSASLASGLFAANEYAGSPLNINELVQIAAKMEGHPDNVAPALLGGMQIGIYEESEVITASVPIPEKLSAVLYVPNVPMPTEEARNLLKPLVSRTDAVYNIGRVALMVQSMVTGELDNLRYATQDMLHQPERQGIFFPLKNIIRAAMNSGALGAFLSGSGSSVLAFCLNREYTIGYEMADAGMKSGLDGEIVITRPTTIGTHVVR
ncbi:MAG: homoserine kinase [SAR202 cluster bacterium]|jgi:homoserine kinase|nr:MAG: homoserine kinase [SAR202 cluster bacterium]MCH2318892.1 homoserine kinase [SAR202 cluster bacterium]MQG74504.1 homoserine kinase [SAR202 cluster bacterium]|tara:strand:+ start:2256 stop:3185 length:930 start_codon:yes stop_codon:yes gene_type:complete